MARLHLTDAAVRALKTEGSQTRVWDATTPGFGVLVSSRSKSWVVMYGSQRKLKVLGHYPDVSLKEARVLAAGLALNNAAASADQPATVNVAEAFAAYSGSHCDRNLKPSTAKEAKRIISSYLVSKHGSKPIRDVKKAAIVAILDGLLPKPSECNHAHSYIRGFFSWSVARGYLHNSPCDRLKRPASISARDRVLEADELKKVLLQARATGYPFGTIIEFLTLTGQRRGEVAAMRWDWINEDARTITYPASITKNKRPHSIPYGDRLAAVINEMPRLNEFLFPAARDRRIGQKATIFNGWGKAKTTFDDACQLPAWTLHDLRRTFATNLAALGVRMEVTEKMLNHVSGSLGGIVGVYQRHEFRDEMRAAIEAWERRLTEILQGEPA